MPPTEDEIQVKFSAPTGISKLAAKIKENVVCSEAQLSGSTKAPAGQWKLRWEIRGSARGKYHLQITVNGQQAFDQDMQLDEWGVDNGFYP